MSDLVEHIRTLNAEGAAWVARDPENRFSPPLVEDPAHWAAYGVYTAADLEAYLEAEDAKERRKAEMVNYL